MFTASGGPTRRAVAVPARLYLGPRPRPKTSAQDLGPCDSRRPGSAARSARFGKFWHKLLFAPVLPGLILPHGERSGVSYHGHRPGNAAGRTDGFGRPRRAVWRLSARTRRRCRTTQIGAEPALSPVSAASFLRAPFTRRGIFVPPALSGPPSSPRTRPDRTGLPPDQAPSGEVAEWLNAPHSKCGIGASLSGVRIPPSPPCSRHSSKRLRPSGSSCPNALPHRHPSAGATCFRIASIAWAQ